MRKAIHYLRLAGAQAAQRAANREAVTYFRSALDLVDSLPTRAAYAEEELSVLIALGPALMTTMTSSAPDVQQVYDRARQLAAHTDKVAELFASVWGSWIVANASGDQAAMRKLVDELFSIAQGQQDPAFLLQAHHAAFSPRCVPVILVLRTSMLRQFSPFIARTSIANKHYCTGAMIQLLAATQMMQCSCKFSVTLSARLHS